MAMRSYLRKLEDGDIPLMREWLYKPYVLRWFERPEDWLFEMRERNGEFSFVHHFIAMLNDEAFGFGQFYDCFDAKEDWYDVKQQGEAFSIDYMIGKESFLNQGFGKEIVMMLLEKIKQFPNAKVVIVQPEKENLASCKLLLGCGFVFHEEKQYYEKVL